MVRDKNFGACDAGDRDGALDGLGTVARQCLLEVKVGTAVIEYAITAIVAMIQHQPYSLQTFTMPKGAQQLMVMSLILHRQSEASSSNM